MKPLVVIFFLIAFTPAHARDVAAKDINELHRIAAFSCSASQKVQYKAGKKSLKSAKSFKIPVKPGGYAKLHSQKLNLLFEAHFAEGIQFSLKQLDGLKDFPYKMKKRTDKKTFVNVEIKTKRKSVFSLDCTRK